MFSIIEKIKKIMTIKNNGRPTKVNIDRSGSNNAAPEALKKGFEQKRRIAIRHSKYLNNTIEQNHRFIKKRTKPMFGFKSFRSAKITLAGIESVRMIQKGQVHGVNESKSTFYNFAKTNGDTRLKSEKTPTFINFSYHLLSTVTEP